MLEFLRKLISFLEGNNIPYMLSGSMAFSIYSTTRSTRDFDFIIHLQKRDVNLLVEHFKDGFYCDKDSIEEAIATKGMFNIIDHQSVYKAC